MRWQRLFEDLENQLAAARAGQARDGLPDLVRAELATTLLADRIRASAGRSLRLDVGDLAGEVGIVAGTLVDSGDGWLLLAERPASQTLVPTAAVRALSGLAAHATPALGADAARAGVEPGIGHVLRALARDRAEVQVGTATRVLVGRIDRVGADYLDVTPATGAAWTVPFAALRVVRSR